MTPFQRNLTNFRAAQHRYRAAVRPGTITIDGVEYACAWAESRVFTRITMTGQHKEQTAVAHLDQALLDTVPATGTTISAAGHDWKIDSTASDTQLPATIVLKLTRVVGS